MFGRIMGSKDLQCPTCGMVYMGTLAQYCSHDGTKLEEIKPISVNEGEKPEPVIISWCEKCGVPFNHSKLTANPESHEKECPICHGPLKIAYPKPGKEQNLSSLDKDEMARMFVMGFVEAFSPAVKQIAINELTKIVRNAF
jgi:hypothetical protein